jgi:hypothetical protein
VLDGQRKVDTMQHMVHGPSCGHRLQLEKVLQVSSAQLEVSEILTQLLPLQIVKQSTLDVVCAPTNV